MKAHSNVTKLTLTLLVALLISSCKKYKYPESTFKGDPAKPENCPFHGKITMYSVNGIDSLDLLDKYIDTNNTLTNVPFSMKDCDFVFTVSHSSEISVYYGPWGNGLLAELSYKFSKDRRKITILYSNYPATYKKNLFISDDTSWDIIRLTKDNNPFKLRTTLDNGNTYEIQIR